jgi:hypothetical protein
MGRIAYRCWKRSETQTPAPPASERSVNDRAKQEGLWITSISNLA